MNAKKDEENVFLCNECHDEIPRVRGSTIYTDTEGKEICKDCFEENYFVCANCREVHDESEEYETPYGSVCGDCYNTEFCECISCGDIIRNRDSFEYRGDYYCEDCYSSIESDDEEREYYTGDKYVEVGSRAFSAEIECYYPDSGTMRDVFKESNKDFGITHDGSLHDYGIEFQTPKLSGKKGERELKIFCDLLDKNKFKVDTSCGLHIHIDTSDYMDIEKDFIGQYNIDYKETATYDSKLSKIKNLMLFYLLFEQVIFSYLPRSRRGNRYCFPISEYYHEKEIRCINLLEDFEKLWYRETNKNIIIERKKGKYDDSRYCGVNFHSMLANNHIEIRYHSGTIKYDKIMNWVGLHLRIIDSIFSKEITYDLLKDVKYITDLSEKQDYMFKILNLPKGMRNYFKDRAIKFSGNKDDTE